MRTIGTDEMHVSYWTAFHEALERAGGPVSGRKRTGGKRTPQPKPYMSYPIGRGRFELCATLPRKMDKIRAELYIFGPEATESYNRLRNQRDDITRELGYPLEWEKTPTNYRISVYLDDAYLERKDDWPRQHKWLAARVNEFHRVFSPRV